MPTFTTPQPIDLAIKVSVGRIDIVASDRNDTVVTVSPTNPNKPVDVRGAEQAAVEFDGQRLVVTSPKPRFSITGPYESIDVIVELPSGSRLTAELSVGAVHTIGRLGATRVKAPTGSVDLEATGDLWVRAGHGSATVGTASGSVEITADHGPIRIGTVADDASLKASHGGITIGECGGELDARLSYGDLDVTSALSSVTAKTAYGAIRIGEVSRGAIQVESGFGEISIGVRNGIPAWLDVSSKDGRVRNELDADSAPNPSEQSVAVRARTRMSDITIRRTA